MLYRSILVSGADFIEIMNFGAREGSMFDDFVTEDIDFKQRERKEERERDRSPRAYIFQNVCFRLGIA